MYLLLPLTKGHLSHVATFSWQIGWPYERVTTVLVLHIVYRPAYIEYDHYTVIPGI